MSEQPKDNSQSQPKQEKFEWTPEKITAVFQGLGILADKYLSFRDTDSKHETEYIRTTTIHDRKIAITLLAFLGSVITVMSILTWLTR